MTAIPLTPARKRFCGAEWDMRVDLAACYRLADLFGMSMVIWNHITARIPGTEHILINKFGLGYDEITASNLVKIDLDGNVINGNRDDINYSGYVIHSAVHRARPDVACVMHTHSRGGIGVAALDCGLLPLSQEASMFFEDIAYHPWEGQSDDESERERIAANLGNKYQMILRNHGLLTAGRTVGECFWRMWQLEKSCLIQMDILSTGQKFTLPDRETCLKSRQQFVDGMFKGLENTLVGHFEWPALLRLAEKKSPGFDS
jgi:ribulose-5-phosphate 4-epimerase/fuculose-1-phosphate aldolase